MSLSNTPEEGYGEYPQAPHLEAQESEHVKLSEPVFGRLDNVLEADALKPGWKTTEFALLGVVSAALGIATVFNWMTPTQAASATAHLTTLLSNIGPLIPVFILCHHFITSRGKLKSNALKAQAAMASTSEALGPSLMPGAALGLFGKQTGDAGPTGDVNAMQFSELEARSDTTAALALLCYLQLNGGGQALNAYTLHEAVAQAVRQRRDSLTGQWREELGETRMAAAVKKAVSASDVFQALKRIEPMAAGGEEMIAALRVVIPALNPEQGMEVLQAITLYGPVKYGFEK